MVTTSIDPRKALGLRIKQLRAEYPLTQEELADRCDLFRTYMSRIESGLANPTLTVLHTLAKGLEVDVASLLAMPVAKAPAKVRSARPVSRGRVAR
ncbi:MAG TPA: helix-turn-helix transcriptional regulator [Polaromonas sp.]|uniref:helix-turn-helix domain-containing protein n=1 Tax=Polaromonas sp. TaxID=1869339 RepID=UPI002D2F4BB8|nr:helix-turn-helix transcriptional regulator [Polaromonas sp.]HYW57038.1 helix-turn-helix transcriptional regulator [Polaromonas sp.]